MSLEKISRSSELLGERYSFIRHESGLSIYFFPKKMTTAFALFATDFGSVDSAFDAAGRETMPDGVAHFLEHKLFSNADGSDSFERFSAFGADANAFTSHTRTVYLFSCTDRFEESFAELLDFVTHPYFTPETVQKEQGIIGEEIRMCRDNPYDRCYYNMLDGLYCCHPVKKDICGSAASIAKITPEILYRAYETYYRPDNMVLAVCGDLDEERVLAIADAHLEKKKRTGNVPRFTLSEPPRAVAPFRSEAGQVAKPIFSIGVKDIAVPADAAGRTRRDAVMAILNELLFSPSGELYNKLYDSGMISPELSADYTLTRDFGFLQIAGEANDPEAVFREITAYIAEKQRTGLSEADFERCRRIEYAEYIKSFDSTEEIANNLLSFAFEGAELFGYADLIAGIGFAEAEALLQSFFAPERYTLSVVYPKDKEV